MGRDANGKRKTLRYSHADRQEVVDWRIKRLAERLDGTLTEPSHQTVEDFFEHWLDMTVSHEVKPRTLFDYRLVLKRYVYPEIGQMRLQKLTAQQIQALYHKRLQGGLGSRTIQLAHAVVRRGLQQAVQWQLIPRNPADAVRRPRVERREPQTLERDQVIWFIRAASDDRLHALYTLAVTAGLRLGELLGLRWSDINMDAGTLTVAQTLGHLGTKHFFGTPKSKASRRTIDLPGLALAALRRWRREQAEERLLIGAAWEYPDLVFTTTVGSPLNPSNVRSRSFLAVLERAGCPKIRFHDLRHTAATLMLSQGVQARVLQDVLGHADIRMTLGTYAHVLREQKKEAARKVDAFLAAVSKS